MPYNIYHLMYHICNRAEESVIFTSSPKRARSLLEEHLDTLAFQKKGFAKRLSFKITRVKKIPGSANKEMVVTPYIPTI
jgi:hypothetical protein